MSIIGIIIGKQNSIWHRIDAGGDDLVMSPADFDAHPIYAGIADDEIDGQHMVRVPAFYYRAGPVRSGPYAGRLALWVSPEPAEGFDLHPAFRHMGEPLPQFWIGKYQGTPDGDFLGSKPGSAPLTAVDFPTMQQAAGRDGRGWMLWSIYQLAAVQMLALIEHATADMQAVIGTGYVDGDGVRSVDDPQVVQAAWRGITGLWGNVWQMVDGLRTSSEREYRIWTTDGYRQFVDTEIEAPSIGWFHRRSTERDEGFDLGAVFLPTSVRSERDESTYGDYFWASSDAVAYHGGNWAFGAHAGLFSLNVGNAASNSYTAVGGRLAKV
ncbi:hypothetical protein [Bordetella hinzii]|uniref:hypothetical protein n=1 Tax=Bordetella hinzii TaxID=103855 RepID=UPI000764B712|nr:hypothetical protein [Bordetella hinzii]KXA71091.1 hypothetical protein AXA74_20530 [Bordetella hinzii LMG 13501]VEH23204.1 Uncharacterised protein [Bordetella hinzii]VEH33534.1 Uncharacterised protein [Bordetella hinzii]